MSVDKQSGQIWVAGFGGQKEGKSGSVYDFAVETERLCPAAEFFCTGTTLRVVLAACTVAADPEYLKEIIDMLLFVVVEAVAKDFEGHSVLLCHAIQSPDWLQGDKTKCSSPVWKHKIRALTLTV